MTYSFPSSIGTAASFESSYQATDFRPIDNALATVEAA